MAGRSRKAPAKRSRSAAQTIARLKRQNAEMRKTVRALMARVERSIDDQGAFSWFQAAAKLEETVRVRTAEYESLNLRLTRELDSRREIELALKQAKLQAELADQSKTRFLAAASHDLRQPLNSALLFLESINEQALQENDSALLQRARVALASLNNLLGTLLDVARLDSGAIEPQPMSFPVMALLNGIGPEFEGVARSAGISLKFMPCSAHVHTDMHLLETMLRNLISNAIRYTPSGRVLVGCRRRRDGLLICVYDTGIGIGREHLEAIFEAYYQVPTRDRPHTAGIGLGLSIVSRLAQLLSIETLVRSEPGRGSMFALLVPYAPSTAVVESPAPRTRTMKRGHGPRQLNVVVIDDNADVLSGMKSLLEKWGHRAITAATATDAVVQLIGADAEPDLVVSDYHLANGVKGHEAIAEVRREFDGVAPAVILTSDPDPALSKRLARRGLPVLAKPLNLAEFRAMLERL
ncbi:MAG TPA: hybrid sensor histidine kinase/response regulator [Steroidobacter sp.]|uniref:ATP-binding response regulator n=1 Tax=Steroidobacter sp. TaxID=1978227 RepID=UPI002ED9961B